MLKLSGMVLMMIGVSACGQNSPQTSHDLKDQTKVLSSAQLEKAAVAVCTQPVGSPARNDALTLLASYELGSRSVDTNQLATSHEACVLGVLPAAIYTNMKSGVPVGTLVGQAVQETGWCKSELAKNARNFHGQKAKASLDPKLFSYWDGSFYTKSSSESPTGSGNEVVSDFMKFSHLDHSFYSVAERLTLPGLPYKPCLAERENTEAFMKCVGSKWAVHATYAEHVLAHRRDFRSDKHPTLTLAGCELKKEEWRLVERFQ